MFKCSTRLIKLKMTPVKDASIRIDKANFSKRLHASEGRVIKGKIIEDHNQFMQNTVTKYKFQLACPQGWYNSGLMGIL